jgi:hypothetical protein
MDEETISFFPTAILPFHFALGRGSASFLGETTINVDWNNIFYDLPSLSSLIDLSCQHFYLDSISLQWNKETIINVH